MLQALEVYSPFLFTAHFLLVLLKYIPTNFLLQAPVVRQKVKCVRLAAPWPMEA